MEKCPPEEKLTLTHFALKAVGDMMHLAPDVNGKLVFGKVTLILLSLYPIKQQILVV